MATIDPRNRCAACGRVCVVEFYTPPDLWAAAAREYASTHLCITCFDERLPEPVGWEAVTVLSGISRWRAENEPIRDEAERRTGSRFVTAPMKDGIRYDSKGEPLPAVPDRCPVEGFHEHRFDGPHRLAAPAVTETADHDAEVIPTEPQEGASADEWRAWLSAGGMRRINASIASTTGRHNHRPDGTPTYPVYRDACPQGCDRATDVPIVGPERSA